MTEYLLPTDAAHTGDTDVNTPGPIQPFVVQGRQGEQMVVLTVRVPASLKQRIDATCHKGIAERNRPWSTPGELARWLLVAGFTCLPKDGEDSEGMGAVSEALAHLGEAQDQIRMVHQLRDRIRDAMGQYTKMGQMRQAVRLIHTQVDRILEMPATAERDWLLGEIREAYGMFLEQDPGAADLVPVTKQDLKPKRGRRKKGTVTRMKPKGA